MFSKNYECEYREIQQHVDHGIPDGFKNFFTLGNDVSSPQVF
jgi:hypothetical protein